MNDILRGILRQLLISNQIKIVELSKDPCKSAIYSDQIKIWNEAIKFDIETMIDRFGGSDDV